MNRLTHALLLVVFAALVLAGCEEFVLFSELDRLLAGSLAIIPSSVIVTTDSSYVFAATGGTPPYDFRVASGGGTIAVIESTTARFEAPSTEQLVKIELTDIAGATVSADVNVLSPQILTIYPSTHTMPTATSYTFAVYGGDPPYAFSVEGGLGSFPDPSAPVYAAPGSATVATVRVTDSLGATRDASVSVVSAGPIGISPKNTTVAEGSTLVFQGYGGTPPYSYFIEGAANGSINTGTGVYSPGSARPGDSDNVHVNDQILADAWTTVTVVPAAPTNLVADGKYTGPQTIEVRWSDNSQGEAGYQLERKVFGEAWDAAAKIAIAANATSYVDSPLAPNTPYTYRIKATHPSGDSTYSELAFDVPNYP